MFLLTNIPELVAKGKVEATAPVTVAKSAVGKAKVAKADKVKR